LPPPPPPAKTAYAHVDNDALARVGIQTSNRPVVDGGGTRPMDLRLGLANAKLTVSVGTTAIADAAVINQTRADAEAFARRFAAMPDAELLQVGKELEPLVRAAADSAADAEAARSTFNISTSGAVSLGTIILGLSYTLNVGGEHLMELAARLPLGAAIPLVAVATIAAATLVVGLGVHAAKGLLRTEETDQKTAASEVAAGRLSSKLKALVLSMAAGLPTAAS
jgi:hypothetical protein